MCTAITFHSSDHYFGRNLDLEYSLNEQVVITPRDYPFHFRRTHALTHHFATVGMAIIEEGYPLYYDATNEKGLSIAGLNFPGNAVYHPYTQDKINIAPFELIPYILGQCETVTDALTILRKINLVSEDFSDEFRLSPLHWIIADRNKSITVEPMQEGLRIYENPVGVLTNNPPFDYHLHNLEYYLNITSEEAVNRFSPSLDLSPHSRGMGGIGLPGDLSSASRFVRAVFTKFNSRCDTTESSSISQFFHILSSVAQQNGCAKVGSRYERTVYSSCCNMDRVIYYYTTYENSQISAVSLFGENLDASGLIAYPLINGQQIRWINKL